MSAHIYSSFPFLCAHAFLSAKAAADTIASFTLRADWGHLATHRMQEMHFLLSAVLSLSLLMAWAGHCSAHNPQPMQFLSALGTRLTPPDVL